MIQLVYADIAKRFAAASQKAFPVNGKNDLSGVVESRASRDNFNAPDRHEDKTALSEDRAESPQTVGVTPSTSRSCVRPAQNLPPAVADYIRYLEVRLHAAEVKLQRIEEVDKEMLPR